MARASRKPKDGPSEPVRQRRQLVAGVLTWTALMVPAVFATNAAAGWMDGMRHGEKPNEGARFAGQAFPDDPDTLGVDGTKPEAQQIGEDVLRDAGDPTKLVGQVGPLVILPNGPTGIPGSALQAYLRAAEKLAAMQPSCHLDWPLLASIGRIESNHARGGRVDAAGNTASPIVGPALNGAGFASISDSDGGVFDGDTVWDRAVGPMQFIPTTWRGYASDGNGDGVSNPHNIYDATVASGRYLCAGGGDLRDPGQRAQAVFRYNHSDSYVRTVLIWADAYARGVTPLPSDTVAPVGNPNPDILAARQPQPPVFPPAPGAPLPPGPGGPGQGPPPGPGPGPGPQPPTSTPTTPPSSTPTTPPSSTPTTPPTTTPCPTPTPTSPSVPPGSTTPPSSTTPLPGTKPAPTTPPPGSTTPPPSCG
ncbi:membrane-bound lytic murein transglycosylase B [Herbihabitans rhizosphaerae]|uniref:Membrane-bound lytic murein transglycosylase B n=1 Tax=Herbihabitans rhizosphaerae TaxID=1872711 RepID=A0A4Q7KKP7_9PSEU|nr:lytic murein transglycosylase [Herbihabitans rhizosphaerae]RZS37055.1 membrane-bound lytic murein transglycosylase B [Herbihabitans rhizosphaerae]